MPRVGAFRSFSPLRMPEHVVAAMPPEVREQWGKYMAAVAQWEASAVRAADAERAAQDAPHRDKQAAVKAVEVGKPAPAATAPKAADLAERARREVEGYVVVAIKAERDYVTAAEAHRDEWLQTSLTSAAVAAETAQASVDAAEEAAQQAAEAFGVWSWLRYADGLHATPTTEAVGVDLQPIRQRLTDLDPVAVEAAVAAEQAQREADAELFRKRGM